MAAPMVRMRMDGCKMLLFTFVISSCLILSSANAWDTDDYELFDLVEEVNSTFYELLGVPQSADSAEIRRAYRKVSLTLHPDKNKEPDAEVRFRNLVAVYEVLKDEGKRVKYDQVLEHGLPNWRQPAFYFRRVRKMGLLEMIVLLSLILTVGHFVVSWAVYIERRFETEEVFRAKKKRERKTRRGKADDDNDVDELLEAKLLLIERPKLSGILPIIFCKLIVRSILATPSVVKYLLELVRERLKPAEVEEDDSGDDAESDVKRPRKKKTPTVVSLPTAYDDSTTTQATGASSDSSNRDAGKSSHSGGEWTDEEFSALLKAVAKFPGGTTDRWEKIAAIVGRSVRDVTVKAQKIKSHCARSVDPSVQGITASRLADSDSLQLMSDISVREGDELASSRLSSGNAIMQLPEVGEGSATRKHRKPTKNAERTLMISTSPAVPLTGAKVDAQEEQSAAGEKLWSQQQQRLLESAMIKFPKGTEERWDRIAELVPDKTKEDCVERYKLLVQYVKEKQSSKKSQ